MTAEEIFNHRRLSLFKDKILCNMDGVYYLSLFDMANILEMQRPNAYKLLQTDTTLKENNSLIKEFGGAKFVPLDLIIPIMETREKKKELIAFNKASQFMASGIAPATYVKGILNGLSPEQKQKALNEILSLMEVPPTLEKSKGKAQR